MAGQTEAFEVAQSVTEKSECYAYDTLLLAMEWLRRLLSRFSSTQPDSPTVNSEEVTTQALEERYSGQRDESLSEALAVLDDEEEGSTVEATAVVPVEFHVESASVEDLLKDEPLIDHYTMATGEQVDPTTADKHLAQAESVAEDMSAYAQVDVPVLEDDFEVISAPAQSREKDLKSLKKDELIALANSRGIDASGTKADIISRLSAGN